MSTNSKDNYRPSFSYWSEVRTLDKKLLELSPPPIASTLGKYSVRLHSLRWSGTEEDSPVPVIWLGYTKLFFGKLGASLLTFDVVKSETSSSLGAIEKSYNYATTMRAMRTNTVLRPDLFEITASSYASTDRTLEAHIKKNAPAEEGYTELINELRRGASGDFFIETGDA